MSCSLVHRIVVAGALALGAAAQCQFSSLTTQSAGGFCNMSSTGCCAIPTAPTQLLPALDVPNCRLNFTVWALEGCCGLSVPIRFLAIGMTPAVIQFPQFGPNCTMWLVPDLFFVMVSTDTVSLPIPPSLPPVTFLAQGAAVVNDPFGPVSVLMTFSNAAAVTLQ